MANLSKLLGLKEQARKQGWSEWIRSDADERAMLAGCRFNISRGEKVVDFFPTFLCHSKGDFARKPFVLLDWQRDELVLPLFGWEMLDEKGRWVRRYRIAYIELPKKNGKSTLASGIGLYMLVADGEHGGEIYSAATNREQAGIVHGEAIAMVKASPGLSEILDVNKTTKQITFEGTNSYYKALSSLPRANEGWNAHCIIADELHKWFGRELYDALQWAFAARSQPLFFQITTAGDDLQSVCYEQHQYAEDVIKGTNKDFRFFPLLKCATREDDFAKPAIWHKANPSLGDTITVDSFKADYEKAKQSPAALNAWKRYRLNIWTSGESVWLPYHKWEANTRGWKREELKGKKCWAGLDLAKTRDTTSLQLIFPWDDGTYRLLSFFWLPEETAHEVNHQVSYLAWSQDDFITLTPGAVCDYGFVFERIRELSEEYQIQQLLFDPYMAEQLTQQVEVELDIPRMAFGQTINNFAGPSAEFERLVICGGLEHLGHPVQDWQIGNAKAWTDCNGNKRPVKPKPDDVRKIDGVVAAVMALAGALGGESGDGPSPYDNDDPDSRTVFL